MSGIAAVLQRDGAPADTAALGRMLARLEHRGPDGTQAVTAGPLALGHCRFWTTPGESCEVQPVGDPAGRYLLALDGRVDNRDELLAELGLPASTSDAAAVLHLFERRGIDGFARIVGPFAVAIWDTVERALTLARDALGDRTLCYAATARAFVAASEEQAVLAHPNVDDALDERRLALYFALAGPDGDATFFAAVREVLPGHAVVVGERGARSCCYWSFEPREPLRLRDAREYADAFLACLNDAVRARLRAAGPVSLLLSGGLDSSAIAGAAARLAPSAPPLAVSWVFDELESCDERRWIDPVVRHCALRASQFPGDGEWPFRELAEWRRNPSSPEDDLFRRIVERARATAREGGARVVLSGMFGDHLYSGTHGWLWERLGQGGTGAALADLARELGRPGRAQHFRAALLPRRAPAVVLRWRRSLFPKRPWLTAHAAGLAAGSGAWPAAAHAALRPAQAFSVLGLLAAHGVSGETFHAASAGVEMRYPFRDRRLVELMLRLPSDQLYRPGETRPVLRLAIRGLVPDEVRERTGKGSLRELFRRGMEERERAVVRATLEAGRPLWRRFVEEDWVAAVARGDGCSETVDVVRSACVFAARWAGGRQVRLECGTTARLLEPGVT